MIGENAIAAVAKFGSTIIDKYVSSPTEREAAKLEMYKAQQDGVLRGHVVELSAIIAEAQSPDPFTSRARPSFLYVMYIMILSAVPVGVLSVFKPEASVAIAEGMKLWLAAIPDALWALFGTGYLGYNFARSYDKKQGTSK
jgi:hypothetical protein